MEKVWLRNYPEGVPAEINPDAYPSLNDFFIQCIEQYRHLPAYTNMGVTITYQELEEYSRYFAAFLQQKLKAKKGDRIAIMLPNLLQYPIVMFGALRAGLIIVNVNPLYTADELTYQLTDSEAETVVVLSNFAQTMQQALTRVATVKNIVIANVGDFLPRPKAWLIQAVLKYFYKKIPAWHIPQAIQFRKALAEGKKHAMQPVAVNQNDIAFLQYTGGTTGISKGAILTHRNIIANIQQADAWFQSLLVPGKETILTALPLYHIFSLLANCLFFAKVGGLNVLITNPRDIPGMIKTMRKFKFTAITGVNTLFNALLKNPDFATLDFSCLKLSLGGGMAVQQVVAEKWQQVTHCPLLEAYGLTETSPCVSINPPNLKAYNGTIGLPVSSTDVAILDDHGQPLEIGQVGELAVKGPQVMSGYWRHPVETRKVFTPDGWLLTGDMAALNAEGYLRLLERKKDMILVSGFNVYPNEIEDVLVAMPGIREAAVVGVADENSGETVKAFVVKEDANLTSQAVIHYARQHLTPYKVPKYVVFCPELPKSNVGKILRRQLRDCVNAR